MHSPRKAYTTSKDKTALPISGSSPEQSQIPSSSTWAQPLTASLQRFGRVEEVAAVAVLLASREATYMTGTEINIDGGLLAGSAAPQSEPSR
jgi:NAD(P)-dependent dehydrogenase (short-subunit alcohol dehydrogenase family)